MTVGKEGFELSFATRGGRTYNIRSLYTVNRSAVATRECIDRNGNKTDIRFHNLLPYSSETYRNIRNISEWIMYDALDSHSGMVWSVYHSSPTSSMDIIYVVAQHGDHGTIFQSDIHFDDKYV